MKVQGAQDQERIREICYYSGILPRQLIFDLNLELAAEKIKLLPYIEDVEIKRDVSGVILIEPVFSKAGAIIKDGNEFVIVTESRKILKRTDILTDKELELPLITGFKTGRIQAGAILRQYRLKLAFEWLKGLPEEFRKNLSELSVRNSLDTIMVFKQGLAVRADTLKRFKEKKENLVYLISYFKKNNVPTEYIDIRFDIGYVVKKL
jgi:cell division septal protein FtsQ